MSGRVVWDRLDPSLSVPVVDYDDGRYCQPLAAIRNGAHSGVYMICRDSRGREVLYVGESHSGRLYDTITRHFRQWKRRNDPNGRRFGGVTYDRHAVRVCFVLADAGDVADLQYGYIQALAPRDNVVDGSGVVELDDGGGDDLPV